MTENYYEIFVTKMLTYLRTEYSGWAFNTWDEPRVQGIIRRNLHLLKNDHLSLARLIIREMAWGDFRGEVHCALDHALEYLNNQNIKEDVPFTYRGYNQEQLDTLIRKGLEWDDMLTKINQLFN